MKKHILLLFGLLIIMSCSKDTVRNKNPYIPNYSFSFVINLSLPSYAALTSNLNPIKVNDGTGINFIIMRVSENNYTVWNANCPNQYPSDCSSMSINGLNAKCSCDNIEYSLFTGVGTGQYTMIPYAVENLGNNSIRVYN